MSLGYFVMASYPPNPAPPRPEGYFMIPLPVTPSFLSPQSIKMSSHGGKREPPVGIFFTPPCCFSSIPQRAGPLHAGWELAIFAFLNASAIVPSPSLATNIPERRALVKQTRKKERKEKKTHTHNN